MIYLVNVIVSGGRTFGSRYTVALQDTYIPTYLHPSLVDGWATSILNI